MKNLEIIYEDNDIILCHKPIGVATQTKRLGQQDMESLLKNYRAKKGELPYIGIVHRLDQPVEGIMVFAKHQKAASSLSKQIQAKMIGKYYYAISAYAPKENAGVLENYLLTNKKTNVTSVIEEKEISIKNAKYAKLEYHVLETIEEKTLFNIKLHTGRQHQIRVQMAHMGCPLIGDGKYGMKAAEYEDREVKNLKLHEPLALCSYRLQFLHPLTQKQMDFCIVPKGKAFLNFEKWRTMETLQESRYET
uniref:RluA family pseudouridine synthase n=1 Tax=Agathobacter sp. TaxID=2021311 RepID=UPI0040563D3C